MSLPAVTQGDKLPWPQGQAQPYIHKHIVTGIYTQAYIHIHIYTGICTQEYLHRHANTGIGTGIYTQAGLQKDVPSQFEILAATFD